MTRSELETELFKVHVMQKELADLRDRLETEIASSKNNETEQTNYEIRKMLTLLELSDELENYNQISYFIDRVKADEYFIAFEIKDRCYYFIQNDVINPYKTIIKTILLDNEGLLYLNSEILSEFSQLSEIGIDFLQQNDDNVMILNEIFFPKIDEIATFIIENGLEQEMFYDKGLSRKFVTFEICGKLFNVFF